MKQVFSQQMPLVKKGDQILRLVLELTETHLKIINFDRGLFRIIGRKEAEASLVISAQNVSGTLTRVAVSFIDFRIIVTISIIIWKPTRNS